jgi:vanillate O-demethylase ferredoxin subunit
MKSDLQWMQAQVVALRDVTPTVREFELRTDGGTAANWEPGAHLQVQVMTAQGRLQTRSYSLVGEGGGDSVWRIAVKRLDDGRGGSLAMWRLTVGDRLQVSTPQNHFPLDTRAPGYLLVAGGIGITPLVLMAERLAAVARSAGVPVAMLYGARHAGEFAYGERLREALGNALVLHEGAAPIDFARAIAALPTGGQLYTCGPVPMLEAVKRAWQAAGRAPADLRFETFGSSGRLAAQAFEVRVPRHDLAITVAPDCTLLEALEAAGVETLSDCRRGECGLCAMDVLAVDGEVDHRDVFLSEHEKQATTRICACVSRAVGAITLDSSYRPDC